MIQILFGSQDHQNRAEALSALTAGSSCGGMETVPANLGLTTLTFWGHGDPYKLCGLTPKEFVRKVSDWKKKNKKLKTLEIITCNARHATTGTKKSYMQQVRAAIRKKHRKLVVKAMPMGIGVAGMPMVWSILKFAGPTSSWYYVTAPGSKDTEHMWPACHMVEAELKGGHDLAAAAKVVYDREKSRKFTLDFGKLHGLRSRLVVLT